MLFYVFKISDYGRLFVAYNYNITHLRYTKPIEIMLNEIFPSQAFLPCIELCSVTG